MIQIYKFQFGQTLRPRKFPRDTRPDTMFLIKEVPEYTTKREKPVIVQNISIVKIMSRRLRSFSALTDLRVAIFL